MMTQSTDHFRATLADQIRWQRQAAALLGKLLALAAKESLPPITWTVQRAGASLVGQVLATPAGPAAREQLDAWKAAVTTAAGRTPDHDLEHALGGASGEVRITVSWEHLPVTLATASKHYPSAGLALVASIWPGGDDAEAGQ